MTAEAKGHGSVLQEGDNFTLLRGTRDNYVLVPHGWSDTLKKMLHDRRVHKRIYEPHDRIKKNVILRELMTELSPIYRKLIDRCSPEYLAYCKALYTNYGWMDSDWITSGTEVLRRPQAMNRLVKEPALMSMWISAVTGGLFMSTRDKMRFLARVSDGDDTLAIIRQDLSTLTNENIDMLRESLKYFPHKTQSARASSLFSSNILHVIDRPLDTPVKWAIILASAMAWDCSLYQNAMRFVEKNGEGVFVDFLINQQKYIFPNGVDHEAAQGIWPEHKPSAYRNVNVLADEIYGSWYGGQQPSWNLGIDVELMKFTRRAASYTEDYILRNTMPTSDGERYAW